MEIYSVLIVTNLVGSVLTRSIPPYDLCMENCGEDPFEEDVIETTMVEMCRDMCNEDEKDRCIGANLHNEVEKRNCWRRAFNRCIVRCGDQLECLLFCYQNYSQGAN
ncbi:hypothetical protein CSKR_102353 [Clonorchis sinensis]|uniref:Uncharacterized protein n=1 Tax=Clonorchis sinensis TaxID=79923 RepID=A0A8T1MXI8_CLOSI|nr:hypothetical protein CSKR_102353 [Clonorchis sinensis]